VSSSARPWDQAGSKASVERPFEPDPALLARALFRLGELHGVDDLSLLRWVVERRMERPRSTVFSLRAVSSDGTSIGAFYKVVHRLSRAGVGPDGAWTESLRDGMARSQELTDRFVALAAAEGLGAPQVLAVDPGSLTVVSLAVPGRPLGKAWRRALTPGGRARALNIYRRIGRAVRLVEQCSPAGLEEDRRSLWRVFDYYQDWAPDVLPRPELDALHRRMEELYDQAISVSNAVIYAHGDLSPGNVLISGSELNLLDLQWPLRFRGYDLANLVYRMENEGGPRFPGWTVALKEGLLEGYGDPNIESQPSWQFTRLQWLLKLTVRPRVGLLRRRPSEALSEMRALL
jgi:hypothetical protein